jgi:plasmid maintenance system antidote protein VapI
MALRRSEALGTTAELWTGMQAQYDLWQASNITAPKCRVWQQEQRGNTFQFFGIWSLSMGASGTKINI